MFLYFELQEKCEYELMNVRARTENRRVLEELAVVSGHPFCMYYYTISIPASVSKLSIIKVNLSFQLLPWLLFTACMVMHFTSYTQVKKTVTR